MEQQKRFRAADLCIEVVVTICVKARRESKRVSKGKKEREKKKKGKEKHKSEKKDTP
jgi:hypothetical protein